MSALSETLFCWLMDARQGMLASGRCVTARSIVSGNGRAAILLEGGCEVYKHRRRHLKPVVISSRNAVQWV